MGLRNSEIRKGIKQAVENRVIGIYFDSPVVASAA